MAFASSGFVGTLAVLVYLGAVALSLPVAAAALLLARRHGIVQAAATVALGSAALLTIVAMAVAAFAGPLAGLALAGVGLTTLVGLWVLPVAIGAAIVHRSVHVTRDAALGFAVAGLPPAMVVSAIVFLAPGGPTRYNLTFLSGPALWLAAGAFFAVVALGPGLAGVALCRYVGRRRP